MAEGRGLPLLSGPPPSSDPEAPACRKCSKEFNILFTRSRKCNHCGYLYCHNCSDYQALMPRESPDAGYDAMNVCAYCIEYLTITAAGRGQLKSMPLAKLRKYVNAYSINVGRVVEKDDLIDRIIGARGPNGCLSPQCEAFYRRYSVPSRPGVRPRGLFSSRTTADLPPETTSLPQQRQSSATFARPDLAPDDPPPRPNTQQRPAAPPPRPQQHQPPPRPQQQYRPPPHPQQYQPPPQPPPQSTHPRNSYGAPPHPPPHNSRPRHSFPSQGGGPYHQPAAAHSSNNLNVPRSAPQQRPRAASAATHPPAPPTPPQRPPPSLDQLLEMPESAIGSLSIGNLKAVLFTNHVNAGMILEKGELVKKVNDLVAAERADRERSRILEEQEDQERIRAQREMMETLEREKREHEERQRQQQHGTEANQDGSGSSESATGPRAEESNQAGNADPDTKPPPAQTKPTASAAFLERTGLCVICQDEEANIAIVDCGHLAMCRSCSDLIMASSRECPLCRTRIVTESRLLRIFKT